MFSKKTDRENSCGVWQVTRRAEAQRRSQLADLTATGAEPLFLSPGTSRSEERAKGGTSDSLSQVSEAAQQRAALRSYPTRVPLRALGSRSVCFVRDTFRLSRT